MITRPDWDKLFSLAMAQEGHFTTGQAGMSGYSPQLLAKYLRNGKVTRVQRGIYRLVHFPPCDNEQLVVFWLWSGREGVFSHATALAMHRLSDLMPARIHMTLPTAWAKRRIDKPRILSVHYADLPEAEVIRTRVVPVTSVARTMSDCVTTRVSPEFLLDARAQAMALGLLRPGELPILDEYLRQYRSH